LAVDELTATLGLTSPFKNWQHYICSSAEDPLVLFMLFVGTRRLEEEARIAEELEQKRREEEELRLAEEARRLEDERYQLAVREQERKCQEMEQRLELERQEVGSTAW